MNSKMIQRTRKTSSRLTKYKLQVKALMRTANFRLTVKVLASKIEISRSAVTDLAAL